MLGVRDVETIAMSMADGVALVADIYRPVGPGQFPVLVMRQPYGRKIGSSVVLAHPAWYAGQGYVVLVQDVRGRGDSGGVFRVLEDDSEDGAETLGLAAGLAGGDGQVATYGFSYHGINQHLALAGAIRAGTKRPDAMAIAMAAFDVRNHWAFEGDAFSLAGNQAWACQMAVENALRAGDRSAAEALRKAAGTTPNGPLPGRPDVLEAAAKYTHYHHWLADEPAYWAKISPHAALAGTEPDVPCLHIGGWHDFMLEGTFAAFHAYSTGNRLERLAIGPWAHLPWGRHIGDLDCGPAASEGADAQVIAFFDEVLKGRQSQVPKIAMFDPGKKAWTGFAHWPKTSEMTLYPGSTGRAAPTCTDGVLALRPGPAVADWMVHDPWRPAPSIGLHLGPVTGYVDRAMVDDRSDVAVYTSAPLADAVTLMGRPCLDLDVGCDRPGFDLFCTLSLVTQQADALTLVAAHRLVQTAKARQRVQMVFRPVCFTLPAGASLRLSIQAAAYPAFAVNPGTGQRAQDAASADALVITLTFFTGGSAAPALHLPILGPLPAFGSANPA